MPLPGFNPPPPGSVPGYVPTNPPYDQFFGPTGTGSQQTGVRPGPAAAAPTAPAPAAPTAPGGAGSTYGGIPPYLRQFDNFAKQFYARTGTWPTEADLAAATSDWWNRTGPWQGTPLPNYITPRTSQAAALFSQQYGRFPTQAEIPVALSLLASPGAPSLAETPDEAAVATVTGEVSPILQGAGRQVFENLANRARWGYATQAVGGQAPTMGFADYLRSQLPTLVGTPQTITKQASQNLPQGVSWNDVSAAGAPFSFSNEDVGRQAVMGAWLNQFSPYARGDMFNAIANRLRDVETQYAGQLTSTTGTGPQSFADYLAGQMKDYF